MNPMRKRICLAAAALLAVTAPSAGVSTPDLLVAHWKFNETSSPFVSDHSGRGNHAMTGYTSEIGGLFNNAFTFDGSRSFVEAPDLDDDLDLTDFTIEGWFRFNSSSGPYGLVTKGGNGEDSFVNDNYGLGVIPDGRLACGFEVENSGAEETVLSAGAVPAGRWVHLACTYDSATGVMKLYQDGAVVGMHVAGNRQPQRQDQSVYIGNNRRINNQTLNGAVDELRLWKAALTDAEILDLHLEGQNKK